HPLRRTCRRLEPARVLPHYRPSQCLGARRIEQPEPVGDRHLTLRTLIFKATLLIRRRSHRKTTRGNPSQPLGHRSEGYVQEDAEAIVTPAARPVGRLAVGQRMHGGIDYRHPCPGFAKGRRAVAALPDAATSTPAA